MYPLTHFLSTEYFVRHKIFIAMPFADEYENIYSELIIPAIETLNSGLSNDDKFTYYRGKDPRHTRSGWIEILDNLFSSHFILGVLSGDNVNVHYELGIAHATTQIERQILIAAENYTPRFDLKDLIFIKYSPDNLSSNVEDLVLAIQDTSQLYDVQFDRQVEKAANKISQYELEIILSKCNVTHFNLSGISDEKIVSALAYLCHSGLVKLSTKTTDLGNNKKNVEYSYYWTHLGNAVIHKLELLSYEDLVKRIKNYNRAFGRTT